MRVITVARKPLVGTVAQTVLKFGTGGINIDGTRLAYSGETDAASATPQGRCTAKSGALAGGTQHDGDRSDFVRPEQKGRYPANLILCHLPDCACVGMKKVKPLEGYRPNPVAVQSDGAIQFNQKAPGYQKKSFTGEDGAEEVQDWNCVEGCPVRELDQQSGVVPTGSWCRQKDGAHPFGDAVGSPYENWKQVKETPGGASRFFKQIQGTSKGGKE